MSERHTVLVYRDESGEWRWHREAANGNIVADSGEGYKNFGDCREMAIEINANADFEILDD